MLSDICLSVSVLTLVCCGQRVGWIKMALDTEIGLGPGHIVLNGDPAPPMERDTVRLYGFRDISTSGFRVRTSRASSIAVL